MNKFEDLLSGLDVEWNSVGSLVNVVRAPTKLKKKDYCLKGKIPIIDQGVLFIAGYTDKDIKTINDGEYIIFGDHSEHIKYVDFEFVQGADGLKILSPKWASAKYLYYSIQRYYKKESSYKRHWSSAKETLIPIPCPDDPEKSLAIQAEIVRILDTFTDLTTELENELVAREKQYEYYRNALLGESDGVVFSSLNSICSTIKTGKLNANAMEDEGVYPFYTCNEKPYKINSYAFDLEAIIISGNGSQVGHLSYYKGKFNAYQRTYVIGNFKENVLVMYIFHYLRCKLKRYITHNSKKGSIPYITMPMLENFTIPIPCPEDPEKSLAIQNEIVRKLDKFTELNAQLTKEIELRKKQYEYYRDMLFGLLKRDNNHADTSSPASAN